LKRRWLKVAYYEPKSLPGERLLARSEWRECAQWIVMYGVEFAEAFAMRMPNELVA
jgi:hypothetical protein